MNGWLAQRLADFGSGEALPPILSPPELTDLQNAEPDTQEPDDYALGEQAGREAAQAECDRQIEAFKESEAERLAEARARWVEEHAEALSQAWGEALTELGHRLGDQLAAVLRPFLDDESRSRALDNLAEALSRLTGPDKPAFRVSGPSDLLEALQPRLDQAGLCAEMTPDEDAVDVVVVADETRIETTIGEWRTRLREDG